MHDFPFLKHLALSGLVEDNRLLKVTGTGQGEGGQEEEGRYSTPSLGLRQMTYSPCPEKAAPAQQRCLKDSFLPTLPFKGVKTDRR